MDLIAASGGRWIFIGMESIDPANLASVNKGFNKPGEYAAVLDRLAKAMYMRLPLSSSAWTTTRRAWRSERCKQIRTWPPGLPVFGLLTPLPGTPLYTRLEVEGRLTRPKHWLEFMAFAMAHTPLKMSVDEAHAEVRYAWDHAYSPEAIATAMRSSGHKSIGYRINIFISRICFRGIYFPQMGLHGLAEGDCRKSSDNF